MHQIMKVIAICGSPKSKGNTALALEILGEKLKSHIENLEYEIVHLRKLDLRSCNACNGCYGKKKCVQDDDINMLLDKLLTADGIVLGSPTYFSNVTSRMQIFIERIGLISKLNGSLMKGKIGASIAVARRMGACVVYSAMNYFFGILEMPIASSIYWNVLIGLNPGDIKNDVEGMAILDGLGKNMAELLVKLH
jgi:multimeric flavodoxin WrbA